MIPFDASVERRQPVIWMSIFHLADNLDQPEIDL
jgi:hypothetical protein